MGKGIGGSGEDIWERGDNQAFLEYIREKVVWRNKGMWKDYCLK